MDDAFELEIELRMVRDDLQELPVNAFNERITLRDRLIELEAAIAAATPIAADSLRSELSELEAKRLVMVKKRMNAANANGGLGLGGIDPNFLHKANRRIDEMTGIGEVEARILEIQRLLESRPPERQPPTAHRPPP